MFMVCKDNWRFVLCALTRTCILSMSCFFFKNRTCRIDFATKVCSAAPVMILPSISLILTAVSLQSFTEAKMASHKLLEPTTAASAGCVVGAVKTLLMVTKIFTRDSTSPRMTSRVLFTFFASFTNEDSMFVTVYKAVVAVATAVAMDIGSIVNAMWGCKGAVGV